MAEEPKEREAFELQAAMRGLDISMFTPPSEKEYRNPDTQSEWQGRKARAQLPSQGGEAVAWQAGFIESGDAWDSWQTCSKEHHDFVKRCPNEWPDYEVRALYTHPADQVADGVVVSRELLRFLLGESELHGVAFGDPKPPLGKFWWRTELRALLNGGQE